MFILYRSLLVLVTLFLAVSPLMSQQDVILSGYISDASSGESLVGAVVQLKGSSEATSSNSYGFYSLRVKAGEHSFLVSYIGYETQEVVLSVTSNVRQAFSLQPSRNLMDEIVVSAQKGNDQVSKAQMGSVSFKMEDIEHVPVIFGEKDLLKTLQLMPGVASAGEGSSNFYVRGGGGDQNLILLDEATVYNASHLLGFFSTFNSDAIKDVQLFKGGIPAQYGGRISSVMDIAMLDGNNKNVKVQGGVGLIASRLKVEGPLVKDKGSFMVSGRRTYADLFLKLSNDETINSSKLYFYDFNAKANYKFNHRNTLYLSGYFGKDDLGYSDLFSFNWGNATATVRWNHILNERLFSNTSLIYSDYSYNVAVSNDNNAFTIASKIKNWNFKEDLSFYANANHTLRFGLHVLQQRIRPASILADERASVNSITIDNRQGIESAAYVSHDWKASSRLSLIYGLRLTDFMVMGAGTFYSYDAEGEPISERRYGRNEVIKHYLHLEPRLSMSFLLDARQSVKASFNRVVQNLHQLTNTTASLPTDQYVVSSENIKPQIADQVALGYFRNFQDNHYAFSVEGYYKKMDNQIDFRNGADLQANAFFEGDLLYGVGRSYGVEWLLRKNKGRLHGWISYTLAKSERQFEGINDGQWFNARQDRTHDLSVVSMYTVSKKWTLGATFVYNTGNAITYPSGKYEIDGRTMFYYTERNGYRMPDYHRLDFSATYAPAPEHQRYQSSWSFSVFNAYNRKNAYIIDFRDSEANAQITETYKVALFGLIPSVTWNFKF